MSVRQQTKSVKQQMMIMRKELSGRGNTQEDVEDDGPVLGPTAGGEQIRDDLLQVLEHQTTELDGLDDRAQVAHENEIGSLDGDVGTGDHGNTHVGSLERRSIVDTVTGDGDDAAAVSELVDDLELLLGRGTGKDNLLVTADDVSLSLLMRPMTVR